ncbi:RHS repeat domain-containing protein [Agromyces aerolatus]|uniref:RHS repeat domain-containing protein n=1 Tax=Agromyces sp. LY-1074 TaxID=3074080 RepID=UPI002863AD88|nr:MULTISPECIES: RHS repeat-associated core domain-containing protein [unclassified Agromyces]MDR5698751.1 RHS repeat-associated core domain-containing protein [Agromyces sp. LY-1074]MDR5705045.1 RHS repeat-associated core domain-containing protein [Agromyces sp. LY-1358]
MRQPTPPSPLAPRLLGVRTMLAVVGAVVCGAVITTGMVAPSWASAGETIEPAVLGGFALGDDVEGLVDPQTGAFSFTLPVAGASIGWDSRAAGVDRSGLGAGWSIAGVAHVETEGGVRVSPSSGGSYPANSTAPSGLDGYLLRDVVFRQEPATIPVRADGLRPAVEATFELVELGGVRTWFSAAGDPLVRMDANGNRTDWEWEPGHRLVRTMGVNGVVTTLDWADPARVQVTSSVGPARRVTGVIELGDGRVAAVVDATGGRLQVGYSPAGLVGRLAGVSGAATEVSWQSLADGRVAVDRVRVLEVATGTELSARRWTVQGGLASGWPAVAGLVAPSAAANDDRYATALTDGASTVVSEFDGNHLLRGREVEVTTRSGSRLVQRQAYDYPEPEGDAPLSPQYAQPTGATVTHLDAAGGRHDTSESFEFDELGRLMRALDGTTYAYNAMNQPVSVTAATGGAVDTAYWASGQRATRTEPGTGATTTFHWDDASLMNDTHVTGGADESVTAAYLMGAGRHARTLGTAATTAYYELDHHGNVTELTDADARLTTSYDYTDYGVAAESPHADADAARPAGDAHRNPFQYAGEYTDAAGTQHLQARTYDPVTMRMTTVDPEPRFNTYHYADLNPITLADPSGRFPALPTWANFVLAMVGVAAAFTGLGGAISAYSTAVATAATTSALAGMIGSKVALGAVVVVASFDVVASVLTGVHDFGPKFMDEDAAFALGASSAALGGSTMFAAVFTRAVGRVAINKLMAKGASERGARTIDRREKRIVESVVGEFRKLGVRLDEHRFRLGLNARAIRAAKQQSDDGKTWTAAGHADELTSIENALTHDLREFAATFRAVDETIEVANLAASTGRRLNAMSHVEAWKKQLGDIAGYSKALERARRNMGRELENATDMHTGRRVFEGGYRSGVTFAWSGRGGVVQHFQEHGFFSKYITWGHAVL